MSITINTQRYQVNRHSDFELSMSVLKDGEAYAPSQFVMVFYIDDWDDCETMYKASLINGEFKNCSLNGNTITVYFDSPRFDLGTLKCRFYDKVINSSFADGSFDTCTPIVLPIDIVAGAGNMHNIDVGEVSVVGAGVEVDSELSSTSENPVQNKVITNALAGYYGREDVDAKLDDVFGNVAYDANAKEIRFYNKDNSRVLATIDSRPFIADGTVADVYIDVSRQMLVVVLNEDAGGTRFSVPLYLIFNSYYKKDEVDNLVSRTVEGMRFDFSQELPLVVPVTKNGSSISSAVDFSVIDNATHEEGRIVVACVNNDIFYQLLVADRAEIAFSRVVALDGYQELLIVDPHNVWSMEDVDLGTGGGGGGYEPPAGGIPKTDLASGVQASLNKADTALQQSDLGGYATQDDVDDAVAALVSSAPQTLDTLKELADALGDDPNFATTMATQLGNKVDKETGKSLMTDAERTKLQGIAAGAEVNVQPNWTQTNTSADDYIKNKPTIPDTSTLATKTELNAKQDKINDLDTIRSWAAAGATAVQPGDLPTKVSDLANDAGYTANQGTVTGISVNGGSPVEPDNNGNVDLTIEEGSGNVVTPVVNVASTGNVTQELQAGAFYKFGTVDSLTITLAAGNTPLDGTTPLLVYGGKFTIDASSSAASLLALPASVDISANSDQVSVGKTYEFNIADNVAIIIEV